MRDVPLVPLRRRKEYALSSEDVGGGRYLSDGSGVSRLRSLHRIDAFTRG